MSSINKKNNNMFFKRIKEASYLFIFMFASDFRVPTSLLLWFEELGPFKVLGR